MSVFSQILLNHPARHYFEPGQRVNGIVRFTTDDDIEYKSIELSFVGKAHCSWTESRHDGKRNVRKTYRGDEVIFKQVQHLPTTVEQKVTAETPKLPKGTYSYPFDFLLPVNVPPSHNEDKSQITYKIKLNFFKASLFSCKKTFEIPVLVSGYFVPIHPQGTITLNFEKSLLLKPISLKNQKITITAEVLTTFLSAGETLEINIVVENDSSVNLTAVKTELVSYTTYTSNSSRKRTRKKSLKKSIFESPMVHKRSVAHLKNTLKTFSNLYSIQNCKVIYKEYRILCTIRLPIPYINATSQLPIVIRRNALVLEGQSEVVFDHSAYVSQPGPSNTNILPSYWQVMNEDNQSDKKGED